MAWVLPSPLFHPLDTWPGSRRLAQSVTRGIRRRVRQAATPTCGGGPISFPLAAVSRSAFFVLAAAVVVVGGVLAGGGGEWISDADRVEEFSTDGRWSSSC